MIFKFLKLNMICIENYIIIYLKINYDQNIELKTVTHARA